MNTDKLQSMVLALSAESPGDDVMQARMSVDALKGVTKEIDASLALKMEEWIGAHGDLVFGEVRYYVGTSKTVKCPEPAKTLDAAFVACGGDISAVGGLLASNPFKHGACREVLGDNWADHFVETEAIDIKEGKPKRGLQKIDTRFIKAAQ